MLVIELNNIISNRVRYYISSEVRAVELWYLRLRSCAVGDTHLHRAPLLLRIRIGAAAPLRRRCLLYEANSTAQLAPTFAFFVIFT